MERMDRLPAIPLITSDPYLSIWMPADTMTQTDAAHWSGPVKPIRGAMTVDGAPARFLGLSEAPEAKLAALEVSPTITRFVSEFGGVRLETRFAAPALGPGNRREGHSHQRRRLPQERAGLLQGKRLRVHPHGVQHSKDVLKRRFLWNAWIDCPPFR